MVLLVQLQLKLAWLGMPLFHVLWQILKKLWSYLQYFTMDNLLIINEAFYSSKFPATFKFANVTPVFKHGTRNRKDNYRPISILLIISKIFEKLICRQLSNHFNIFPKFQWGFWKGFNAQHCLLSAFLDKWKKVVYNNKALLLFSLTYWKCLIVFAIIYYLRNYMLMDCHSLIWKWFNITFWIKTK